MKDLLCDEQVYIRTITYQYLGIPEGQHFRMVYYESYGMTHTPPLVMHDSYNPFESRPKLISNRDVGRLKWMLSCSNKRFSIRAENNELLLWRPFGGLEMDSNPSEGSEIRRSLWTLSLIGNNQYLIQSGYKSERRQKHCLTIWKTGNGLITTNCRYRKGTPFIIERINPKDLVSQWLWDHM